MSLPCAACGRVLDDAMPGYGSNQPYRGTAFNTRGHYGSTVFDPMDDTALEINVCDECLVAAGIAGSVLHHKGKKAVSWKRDAVALAPALAMLTASVDTRPQGGDAVAAPFTGSAVPSEASADAQKVIP